MRTMEIREGRFMTKDPDPPIGIIYSAVMCAFDEKRVCKPSCAACLVYGTNNDKAECQKNGDATGQSFLIGWIKTEQ